MGEQKAREVLAGIQRSLPPGTSLTYQALSVNPAALALTLRGVRLTDEGRHLEVSLGSVVVSDPGFAGKHLRSLDLALNEVSLTRTSAEGSVHGGLLRAQGEDLDLDRIKALGRALKEARDPLALDPAALAAFDLGPVRLEGLTVDQPTHQRALAVGEVTISGVSQGRLGQLDVHDIRVRDPEAEARIDALSLVGFDAPRALAWARQTQGALLVKDKPAFDTLGVTAFRLEGVEGQARDLGLVFDRLALADLDSRLGVPTRLTFDLEGAVLPVSLLDRRHQAFFAANAMESLKVSVHWAHAIDDEARRLSLGPLRAEIGDVGAVSGGVTLDGLTLATVLEALERPERLLDAVRLSGFSAGAEAEKLTAAYLDVLLAEGDLKRSELLELLRTQLAPSLRQTVGADLAERLVTALDAFLLAPGSLAVSAQAKDEPMTLTQLGMGLALAPEKTVAAYDVRVEHRPRFP
ncbi:hypothetical protein [Pararhodospirillum photometricum]|uniref:Uncharacterized protein n=1 Tax=Pararhodospirillum photometricum DSM 122 TaxID=1150469 RepID=H6SQV0_PARPM|nr:hypothetical protein [Pararhodospirillum photometricum]CCG07415.1 Putative uncharacterized protein [Pararhodospirillum photometricum DSM 122]